MDTLNVDSMKAETRTGNNDGLRTPPVAPGLPLLGNTVDLLRDPLAFFLKMYREIGPVFQVAGPGRHYTVLAGPEANRKFVDWEAHYFSSEPVYRPYGKDLGTPAFLVALDGDAHRSFRRELRPGFSREAIAPHLPRMIGGADAILDRQTPGASVNVTNLMQALVVEQIGLAMGGCPTGHHVAEVKKFGPTFVGAGVGGFPGFLRWRPRYRFARGRVLSFLRESISKHRGREMKGCPADLIDLLLTAKTPEGRPLNETEILATAQAPYSSSVVYVASACGFLLYELLRHPDLLERVRGELDALFATGTPDLETLRRSPWLRGAMLETQRMHTIAISAPRYVHHSFEYAGYRIDRGAITLTATAVTHYLPEYFPDPYTFDAARFVAPRNEHRQTGMLVPYGLGSHACVSAGVVDTLVMLTVGRLLHRFDIRLDPHDYKLKLSVTPFPAPSPKLTVRILKERPKAAVTTRSGFEGELVDLLPDVGAEALADASDRSVIRQYQAGDVVIREGEPADAFFIIASGSAEVVRETQAGAPAQLATLGAGDYFGEIGLLRSVPRTATVRAATELQTIVLDREAFFELISEADLTSREIAGVLRRRLVSNTLGSALPQIPREQIEKLWPECTWLEFGPGAVIVQQGEPADYFYVIVRGRVEVVSANKGDREIFLCNLKEGDYFGEVGLLQGRPRTATVRATADGPVELLALDLDTFKTIMAGGAGDQIAAKVAERLCALAER